jgi:SHS2 domain-containing protein
VMVDRGTLQPRVERSVNVSSESLDRLLYDFLTELVVIKDVESLLFKDFSVTIDRSSSSLKCVMKGEEIDRERHSLRNDVKAVTMHMFGVKRQGNEWSVTVVLDI